MKDRYHVDLAAAYVRGIRPDHPELPDEALLAWALDHDVRIHRFKRTALPRVNKVVGWMKGLLPSTLLDIGAGRGTSLWPILDALPHLSVTAVETHPVRVRDLDAVRQGGLERLHVVHVDAARLDLEERFDGVTILEVLEHVADPVPVAARALAHATRFVVASVPSQPDENPEHIRLFDGPTLERLLRDAGCRRVQLEWVRGHIVALGHR